MERRRAVEPFPSDRQWRAPPIRCPSVPAPRRPSQCAEASCVPGFRKPGDQLSSAAWGRSAGRPLTAGDVLPSASRPGTTPLPQAAPLPLPDGGAQSASCEDRMTRFTSAAFDTLVGRASWSRRTRTGWAIASRGPRFAHAGGADILSDATPIGLGAGAGVRSADPADGRSSDDRRLSEDRNGYHGRSAARRSACAGRLDRVHRCSRTEAHRRAQTAGAAALRSRHW